MRNFLIKFFYFLNVDRWGNSFKALLRDCYIYRLKLKGINLKFVEQGSGSVLITSINGNLSKFKIEETSHLKSNTFIDCTGGVYIGNYVHPGRGLTIFSANHNYKTAKKIPYDDTIEEKPVAIKDFVWIGANVSISPGVVIEEGSIIANGSVVVKDVPFCAIVGGNPATIIGYRNIDKFLKLKNEKHFY